MGRDTYSESYTSRQEIVPLDKSTQASAKESPPPWPGALIPNGASYRIPRIRCADRTGFARLPARSPAG